LVVIKVINKRTDCFSGNPKVTEVMNRKANEENRVTGAFVLLPAHFFDNIYRSIVFFG